MDLKLFDIDKVRVDKIKLEQFAILKNNQKFVSFVNDYNLTRQEIFDNLGTFIKYFEQVNCCDNCLGIKSCTNKGFTYNLKKVNNQIINEVVPCELKLNRVRIKSKYAICHIEEEVFDYSLKDTLKVFKNERKELLTKLGLMIKNKDYTNGIYLYGDPKVGKSFIMKVFSKALVENTTKSCAYINLKKYMDGLIENSRFYKDNFDEDIIFLTSVNFLFLDDFGLEEKSDFTKGSIIKVILEERNKKNLPTFIISPYSLKDLYNVYRTPGNGTKYIQDIIDLIKENSSVFELRGMKYPL